MIINGKYVEYDDKKVVDIQSKINKTDEIRQDTKSEYDPAKILGETDLPTGLEFGFGQSISDINADEASRIYLYDNFKEMVSMEFINKAVEIVADDSTQMNEERNVLKISSNDEGNKQILQELFHNRLDTNSELWNIVYDTVKLGDNFFEIIPDSYKKPTKINKIRYLEPARTMRVERNGKIIHYYFINQSAVDRDCHARNRC